MQLLNLPAYQPVIKNEEGSLWIRDVLRARFVRLTPEEWVRQHLINYFIQFLEYPAGRIAVEMQIKVNQMFRRPDLVVYGPGGRPLMIVECKSYHVALSKETFEQAVRYNSVLNVCCIAVSNGIDHYCCKLEPGNTYAFLEAFPRYSDLLLMR